MFHTLYTAGHQVEEEVNIDFRDLPGYTSSIEPRSEGGDSGIQVENEGFSSQVLPQPGRNTAIRSESDLRSPSLSEPRSPSPFSDLQEIHRSLVAPLKETKSSEGRQQLHYEFTLLTTREPTDEETKNVKSSITSRLMSAGVKLFQDPAEYVRSQAQSFVFIDPAEWIKSQEQPSESAGGLSKAAEWVQSQQQSLGALHPVPGELSRATDWEAEQIHRTEEALGGVEAHLDIVGNSEGTVVRIRWVIEVGTQDGNQVEVGKYADLEYEVRTEHFVLESSADGGITSVDIETV